MTKLSRVSFTVPVPTEGDGGIAKQHFNEANWDITIDELGVRLVNRATNAEDYGGLGNVASFRRAKFAEPDTAKKKGAR